MMTTSRLSPVICVLVAIAALLSVVAASDQCKPADLAGSPTVMKVFEVEERGGSSRDPLSLVHEIRQETWQDLSESDALLAAKMNHLARADFKDTVATIDSRFNVEQLLAMNNYDVKTDCTRDKSKKRIKFCASLTKRRLMKRGDNLSRNLANYCRAMANKVDKCCMLNVLQEGEKLFEVELERVGSAQEKVSHDRNLAKRAGEALSFRQAFKASLDRNSILRVSASCEDLDRDLSLVQANKRHNKASAWFDDYLTFCRKIKTVSS